MGAKIREIMDRLVEKVRETLDGAGKRKPRGRL